MYSQFNNFGMFIRICLTFANDASDIRVRDLSHGCMSSSLAEDSSSSHFHTQKHTWVCT
jgi:hypothetical protein